MTPEFTLQHRNVWLRKDKELIGRVLAEKQDRLTDRERSGSSFRVGDNSRG